MKKNDLLKLSLSLFLITLSACKEEKLPQAVADDKQHVEEQNAEGQKDYWQLVDISFAVDSYDGHAYNYTEFADFDLDGYIDIISSASRDGLKLYPNSGAGSFFSPSDHNIVFDPATVDLLKIGHWGDKMDATSTFALADYNRDGFLDAVIEGPYTGTPHDMDPVIIFAEGNGETLVPRISLPTSPEIGDFQRYAILGSYYFSSTNSERIVYKVGTGKTVHNLDVIGAYDYNPDCPYSFAYLGNPGLCNGNYYYMAAGILKHSDFEIDAARSQSNSFLFINGGDNVTDRFGFLGRGTFVDNAQIRAYWGATSQWQNDFNDIGPKPPERYLSIQTDIGQFEQGIYSMVDIIQTNGLSNSSANLIYIIKDFEHNTPDFYGDVSDFSTIVDTGIENGLLMGGVALDYDKDGLDDIIVSFKKESDLEILVFENKGNYEFEKSDTIQRFSLSNDPVSVKFKKYDFNNDGDMDLYLQGTGNIIINN